MNNLPVSQNQISLRNLSVDEVAAIEAGSGIKIKDYSHKDLYFRVATIIKDCLIIKGEKKMTEDEQGKITAEFTAELKSSFPTFTVEEIKKACRDWAVGKIYEDGLHVSVHNLCKAIWAWRDIVKREALYKLNLEEQKKEREITEAKKIELKEQFKKDLLDTFSEYRENRQLDADKEYYHSAMYEYLEKNGYRLNSDLKCKIWQESFVNKDIRAIPKSKIHDFLRGIELSQKQRAKAAALKYVFDWLINNNKSLEL